MFQTLFFCDNVLTIQVIYYLKIFLNIIRFIIPLLLIVTISIDLYKAMMLGEEQKNVIQKFGKRILASIIIFLIPTFINLLMIIIGNFVVTNNENEIKAFTSCYNEASLELIKKIQNQESLKLKTEEEAQRQKNLAIFAKNSAENKAAFEKARREKLDSSSGVSLDGSYNNNLTDLTRQNGVYIQNGTFYIPSTASGKECPTDAFNQGYNNKYGYNNYFYTMLENLIKGAKSAGYNLSFNKQGCRSYNRQKELANRYASTPGRAAKPGNSRHGWGIASDLTFYKNATTECGSSRTRSNCPGMAWVHDNAYKYGLKFPLLNASYREDWHIEPINLKKY